jgi:hypothetical protein
MGEHPPIIRRDMILEHRILPLRDLLIGRVTLHERDWRELGLGSDGHCGLEHFLTVFCQGDRSFLVQVKSTDADGDGQCHADLENHCGRRV